LIGGLTAYLSREKKCFRLNRIRTGLRDIFRVICYQFFVTVLVAGIYSLAFDSTKEQFLIAGEEAL
jgi:hypothetical protein